MERRDVRERIDLAFHIMDREYGVTRLLDPEGMYQTQFIKSILIVSMTHGRDKCNITV